MTSAPPLITLPAYKAAPPYGKKPMAWFLYFLKPHAVPCAFFSFLNLLRYTVFKSIPFFLGLFVGLINSGRAAEDPMVLVLWIAVFAILNFIAFLMLVIILPQGRLMDTFSKQISLFGFTHYLSLPEAWHESRASGEKLQRLLTARQSSAEILENLFWHGIAVVATAVAVIISVLALDGPWYYIVFFYLMVCSYVALSHYTAGWMRKRYAEYNRTLEQVIGGVYEFLVSTATVRFFNLRRHVLEKAGGLEGINHGARMQVYKMVFYRWFTIDCNTLFWIVAIISLASYEMLHGRVSIGAYTAIISLTLSIWYELENFAVIYIKLVEQWEGFKRLTEILNNEPVIRDSAAAIDLPAVPAPIRFDRVSFEYHEEEDVIDDFTLEIKPGEKIGLIGPSGAGKSTIVKLLMRFYDVDRGGIFIGEHDIRNVRQESLQNDIAIIPQDIVLFNHPILENIRYGRLDAPDEAVIEAARRAHAHEFIEKLPDGYRTIVGERGVKLSGGQRQRVAIARAILKNSPVLILDEATSSLDSESEKMIQDSLYELMEGKTVIAIAHRLSTISHLDRLIVMDRGRIVEQGAHNELLQKSGLYARLWSLQSGGFIGV